MNPDGLTWRKASASGENGGDCIEVASTLNTIAIRDSKDPDGFKLLISADEACALSERIKNA